MMDEEIGNRIRFRYAPNRQIPHNHSCLCQPFNWRRNIAPTALSVLNSVFGLPAFRGAQEEIVMHVTGGGDCLVLMPTVTCMTISSCAPRKAGRPQTEFRTERAVGAMF